MSILKLVVIFLLRFFYEWYGYCFFLKSNCFINLNLNMQSAFHANNQVQRIVVFCVSCFKYC